jgi:hypothetical protein
MQRFRVQSQGVLQRLQQGDVLGDVVILPPNPFCDPDCALGTAIDYNPDSRRTGTAERTAIDVGH